MLIKKRLGPCRITVEKTYSQDDLLKIEEKILKSEAGKVQLSGFRPGNVPLDHVKTFLKSNGRWEELRGIKLQEEIIADWVKEKKNEEIGEIVRIMEVRSLKNEPLTLECHLEFFPRLGKADLGERYKNIKVPDKNHSSDIQVPDEEVESGLLELQKRRTVLKPVADVLGSDRSAFLKITCHEGDKKTEKTVEGRDLFQWGKEQYGKKFDEKTQGMSEGEEKTIEANEIEEKYRVKLRNLISPDIAQEKIDDEKKTSFKVRVEKIFTSEIPEIDDKFAQSLGKFQGLKDLKSSMKQGIKLEKLYRERDKRKESFAEALLKAIPIEVPDSIVARSAAGYKKDFERRLGKKLDDQSSSAKEDKGGSPKENVQEKFNKIFEEKARRELKLQRILEAIALAEKITPSLEEVEKETRKILQSFSSPKEAKNVLGDPQEFKSRVTLSLCFDKTIRFLEKENGLLNDIDQEIAELEKDKE